MMFYRIITLGRTVTTHHQSLLPHPTPTLRRFGRWTIPYATACSLFRHVLTRDIKRIRCGRNGDAKRNQIKITGWAGLCIVMVGPFLSMVAVIIDIDGMSVLETENDSIVLINAYGKASSGMRNLPQDPLATMCLQRRTDVEAIRK